VDFYVKAVSGAVVDVDEESDRSEVRSTVEVWDDKFDADRRKTKIVQA
jgi:hypothetical protein